MLYDEFDQFEDTELETQIEDWEELSLSSSTAFLATLARQSQTTQDIESSLSELERLADTANITVIDKSYQRKNKADKGSFFGKGWLEEIKQKMLQTGAGLLIVNEELSPMQARNIEHIYGIKVLDRTEVILSIFHNHAKTRESKLEVKLAELEYQLPRLKKLWGHFDKERGSSHSAGGTASRGMGEKQIEIDRRIIKRDIARIKRTLSNIIKQKETQRKQREKVKKICLIGYTNAGKSTIFNALTDAGVLVEDKLFATLDSTTRQLKMDVGGIIVISDTVGFISDLPHHLIASFKATLMEVEDADLLLHVADSSDERCIEHIEDVTTVLKEISSDNIPQMLIMNKIDLLDDIQVTFIRKRFPEAILISAMRKINLDNLLHEIDKNLFKLVSCKLRIPYTDQKFVSRLYETAKVISEQYVESGIELDVVLSNEDKYFYDKYLIE